MLIPTKKDYQELKELYDEAVQGHKNTLPMINEVINRHVMTHNDRFEEAREGIKAIIAKHKPDYSKHEHVDPVFRDTLNTMSAIAGIDHAVPGGDVSVEVPVTKHTPGPWEAL